MGKMCVAYLGQRILSNGVAEGGLFCFSLLFYYIILFGN